SWLWSANDAEPRAGHHGRALQRFAASGRDMVDPIDEQQGVGIAGYATDFGTERGVEVLNLFCKIEFRASIGMLYDAHVDCIEQLDPGFCYCHCFDGGLLFFKARVDPVLWRGSATCKNKNKSGGNGAESFRLCGHSSSSPGKRTIAGRFGSSYTSSTKKATNFY